MDRASRQPAVTAVNPDYIPKLFTGLWVALILLLVPGMFLALTGFSNVPTAVLSPGDMIGYLTQARCPDGRPPTECNDAVPQRAEDEADWRKHDYGFPADGYQAQDAALSTDGAYIINTWENWPPWTGFTPANGDGGEIYRIADGKAKVLMTRDGGTPHDQYFCGTGGWLLFDNQPPTGSWRHAVTWLNISADRVSCPSPLNPSFTRWRRETLTIPFNIFGVKQTDTVSCIIHEHYNGSTIANAVEMEQAIWCKDWGRIWAAAYKTTGEGAAVFGYRLPAIPWPGPPERPDLKLADARLSTNIQPNPKTKQAWFGWPAAGYRP